MVKCKQCGKEIDKDLAIVIKPRFFVCSEECKQKYLEKAIDPRKELLDYIDKNFNKPINWVLITAQLKNMTSGRINVFYSYDEIKYVLWYILKIEKKEVNDLGCISYFYDKAKRYYQWKRDMEEKVKKWKFKDEEKMIYKKEKEEKIFD